MKFSGNIFVTSELCNVNVQGKEIFNTNANSKILF